MPPLRIDNFSGEMPIQAAELLPPNFAAYAENCWLYKGELRGYKYPLNVYTALASNTLKTYRIPSASTSPGGFDNSTWLEFSDEYVDALRAPMVNDTFQRYYWTGPATPPQYNTLARIQAGNTGANAPFLLGIPTPTNTPTLSITGVATTNQVTRAYAYTYVSAYNEEGPPSPPVVATSSSQNTWTLNWAAPAVGVTTGRNLAYINIYRTIADGQGNADFFFVAQVAIGTTTYTDTLADTAISGNNLLQSATWAAPPALQGIVALPNGMLAGWANSRDVWFCEPYRPHAWPAQYTVSLDYPIVGMSVMGMSLVVATQGKPYTITGSHPSIMALLKISAQEPCVSRHSIASGPDGVYYASLNGLMLVNPSISTVVTASLFSRQDWAALNPAQFQGVALGRAYIAFAKQGSLIGGTVYDGAAAGGTPIDGLGGGTPVYDGIHSQWTANTDQGDNGIIIDASSENVLFTRFKFPAVVQNVYQDEYNGEVCLLSTNATQMDGTTAVGPAVFQFDPKSGTTRLPYLWRSKRFQVPFKQSFIGCKVFFSVTPEASSAVIGVRNTSQPQTFNPATQYLLLRVYADDRLALTRELQVSGELVLFPSGFRADFWQFELNGQVAVKNLQVATSVKELQLI